MIYKTKSGKIALLFNFERGALVEGTGAVALSDNAWYQIESIADTGSALPTGVIGMIFKTPDSGNPITPAVGDDVYPMTVSRICKGDANVSNEKGTIETTDDCSDGYTSFITDGFVSISGDVSAYEKFDEGGTGISATQLEYLKRFYDVVEDDGAGNYTLTPKNDDDVYIGLLQNSDQIAEGNVQMWIIIPAIVPSLSLAKPLKGVQSFDFSFQKGEGPACVYMRTTNSEETVF